MRTNKCVHGHWKQKSVSDLRSASSKGTEFWIAWITLCINPVTQNSRLINTEMSLLQFVENMKNNSQILTEVSARLSRQNRQACTKTKTRAAKWTLLSSKLSGANVCLTDGLWWLSQKKKKNAILDNI